ncbi:hypothetical protein WKW79_01590 [Variovorax robiniae]|uniref:Uncharacterized protein n=1 Tax=Variovorax robiniae TaxID=1836199 RepID=A0ABU8X0P6_9BURK
MAILSIEAQFGQAAALGTVFLGGTTALNLLGQVSAGRNVPETWVKKLNEFISCNDGASFRLGGCDIIKTGFYVKAVGIEFKQTEHGDKGPAYWELAENVSGISKAELAARMRRLIESPGTKEGPWVATLTAAMFLSEVTRNPRSFMVNLMLLDLIQGGIKYGKAGNKELDFGSLLKFDSENKGKSKPYTYADGTVKVGKGAEAGTVRGGKLPMSQKDAMVQYQQTVPKFEYQNSFHAYAKQSALNLQSPANAGVGYHFSNALLEKECTVVLRWLIAWFAKYPLRYQTGSENKEVTLPAAWGKGPTKVMQASPITVPTTLLPLRDQVRKPAWIDAETDNNALATALKKAVSHALGERQTKAAALL